MNKAIEADEEAAKDFNHLKFTEGVINGRITVVENADETNKRTKAKKAANKAIFSMKKAEKAMQKQEFTNYVKQISKKGHK